MRLNIMKNPYRKINERHYSLADLVAIVNSCTRNSREAVATVADLLQSGRVLLEKHGELKRVKVA